MERKRGEGKVRKVCKEEISPFPRRLLPRTSFFLIAALTAFELALSLSLRSLCTSLSCFNILSSSVKIFSFFLTTGSAGGAVACAGGAVACIASRCASSLLLLSAKGSTAALLENRQPILCIEGLALFEVFPQ